MNKHYQIAVNAAITIKYVNGDELLHLPPTYRCQDQTCPCRTSTGSLLLSYVDTQHLRAERLEDPSPTQPLPYFPQPDSAVGETWRFETQPRRQPRHWWQRLKWFRFFSTLFDIVIGVTIGLFGTALIILAMVAIVLAMAWLRAR